MPKVENAKDEARLKADRLEEIAQDSLKFMHPIITRIGHGSLGVFTRVGIKATSTVPMPKIIIWCRENKIDVNSENYFPQALSLAETYERTFPGTEFTVRKTY